MAAFPTFTSGAIPDSKQFKESKEDPVLRSQIEGGYVATRPKHTRNPRKTWSITIRQLTNADKALLDAHWNSQHGGSLIFDWVNPQNSTTYQVRYKTPQDFSYVGSGNLQRWDCSFSLEQA